MDILIIFEMKRLKEMHFLNDCYSKMNTHDVMTTFKITHIFSLMDPQAVSIY